MTLMNPMLAVGITMMLLVSGSPSGASAFIIPLSTSSTSKQSTTSFLLRRTTRCNEKRHSWKTSSQLDMAPPGILEDVKVRRELEPSPSESNAPRLDDAVTLDFQGHTNKDADIEQFDKENRNSEKTLDVGEIVGLGAWMGALCTFVLVNNFYGPWPANILHVPEKLWPVMHGVGGMLFGGGIILTTCIEWLVTNSKNKSVWNFWFEKVPALDSMIVLPALTASIVSGTALSIDHYQSLAHAPFHVTAALGTLVAFAGWWGVTDLTTQGRATERIAELTKHANDSDELEIPGILQFRKFSNVVSCGFVAALYMIMITKPGFN